jgi:isoleucyl-tRNA synthetase
MTELTEASLKRFGLEGSIVARTRRQARQDPLPHPFYDRLSPVFVADYVGLDAGTGIVHSAPAYGVDDFNSCKANGFTNDDILSPVQSNGVYAESLPFFGGLHIWKANPVIVEKLQEVGALFSHEKISHSYMHCWRHKTPLIYRATAQWFVGMDLKPNGGPSLRELALQGVEPPVLPGLGPGAPARHDRQPARLVHLAPAQLGRADPLLPAQAKPASCTRAPWS